MLLFVVYIALTAPYPDHQIFTRFGGELELVRLYTHDELVSRLRDFFHKERYSDQLL
jgi:hypothetical protein